MEQEKGRQIIGVTGATFRGYYGGLSQIYNHLVLCLCCWALVSFSGDYGECQGKISESQEGPRGTNKTKLLRSVSCPGLVFRSEEK